MDAARCGIIYTGMCRLGRRIINQIELLHIDTEECQLERGHLQQSSPDVHGGRANLEKVPQGGSSSKAVEVACTAIPRLMADGDEHSSLDPDSSLPSQPMGVLTDEASLNLQAAHPSPRVLHC